VRVWVGVLYSFLMPPRTYSHSQAHLPRSMIPTTGSRRVLKERCRKVTGSCRKTPEIVGTWKQYFHRKMTGFFPVNSSQLPVLSGRKRSEIIGKNPKNFRPEYCFHKITGIIQNRQFPGRTVRPG
jgi:hypothetical protein